MKMTLNKFSVLFAMVMIAALMGCGSSPAAAPAAAAPAPAAGRVDQPEWLNELPPPDAIWGIGTAKQSSTSMSMTIAESRARVAIARQLRSKVQAMLKDYTLNVGNDGNQASTSLQEDVDRQIVNMDISNARPIKRWQAPDGTWWFLVELKNSDAKNAVASILRNEEAAYAQFKAQQALQMLDAQLAKNEKPIQVDN